MNMISVRKTQHVFVEEEVLLFLELFEGADL